MTVLASSTQSGKTHLVADGWTLCGQIAIGWSLRGLEQPSECSRCNLRASLGAEPAADAAGAA